MSELIDHPSHYGGDTPYEAINKTCSSCEQAKCLSAFPPDLRRKDGRGSKCRECARAVQAAYYSRYPAAEAARRQKNAEFGAAWYRQNRESQVRRMRWGRVLKLYGLTQEDYEQLLATQDGKCAICRTHTPCRDNRHFAIDHNHRTGKVRGLLCHRCNAGIGFFSDEPTLLKEAANYVERHAGRE